MSNACETDVEQTVGPEPATTTRSIWRTIGWFAAWTALVLGALVMLWPVLSAPINADQRYMYLEAPGRTAGHWTRMLGIPIVEIPQRLHQGRFAPLAFIVQWVSYTGVTLLSVATATPAYIVQGAQKLVLLLLGVASVVAFTASLRGRDARGRLVGVGRQQLVLVGAAVSLLTAVGTQAQGQFRNGWTTYAVLTYGAIVVGFAVPALALFLTRRVAATRRRAWRVVAVLLMVAVGFALNSSYELYYVVFPLTVLLVLVQPVSHNVTDPDAEPGTDRVGRRARMLVLGALTVSFAVSFVAVRVAIGAACNDRSCYSGVKPQLGAHLLPTWGYNLLSSIPGSGRGRVAPDLSHWDVAAWRDTQFWMVAVCVLAAAGLVGIRALQHRTFGGTAAAGLAGALRQGAVYSLLLSLGSAAIMSISEQAQGFVTGVGITYRHTVVTWVAFVVSGVLLLIAADLTRQWRTSLALWTATAAVAALLSSLALPFNLAATRLENLRPGNQAVASIYDELNLGDPSRSGDERRCATIREIKADLSAPSSTQYRIVHGADLAYRYLQGRPYCSTLQLPGS